MYEKKWEDLDELDELDSENERNYIYLNPNFNIRPPITPKITELPFDQISPEKFEQLTLTYATNTQDQKDIRLYGKKGQIQYGIDLIAKISDTNRYWVCQCKRYTTFNASQLDRIVEKFLNYKFGKKTDIFILAITFDCKDNSIMDEYLKQKRKLEEKRIEFILWDYNFFYQNLKKFPEIVDDFFGRNWVEEYCGKEVALNLKKKCRLTIENSIKYREELGKLYNDIFNLSPIRLPKISYSMDIKIEDLFVIPDIKFKDNGNYKINNWQNMIFDYFKNININNFVIKNFDYSEKIEINNYRNTISHNLNEYPDLEFSTKYELINIQGKFHFELNTKLKERKHDLSNFITKFTELPDFNQILNERLIENNGNLLNFFKESNNFLILGEAGSGKSLLSKFLFLELFSPNPKCKEIIKKWGKYLPIWIPFQTWVDENIKNPQIDLIEFLQNWLKSINSNHLFELIKEVFQDNRILLIVDGLDEWGNQEAGIVALNKIKLLVKNRVLPIIATSRPEGFKYLNIELNDWKTGQLNPFSIEQQKKIVLNWLNFIYKKDKDDKNFQLYIQTKSDKFFKILHDYSEYDDFAGNPLLLSLLLSLFLQSIDLPRNSFEVFYSVINLLTKEHPLNRRDPLHLSNKKIIINSDDLFVILSNLAYFLTFEEKSCLINKETAKNYLISFLNKNPQFQFNIQQAKEIGTELVRNFIVDYGILVEKTQSEISFLHNRFQEFLTAYNIFIENNSNPQDFIIKNYLEIRNHNIIKCLFYLIKTRDRIDKLLGIILDKYCNQNKFILLPLIGEIISTDYHGTIYYQKKCFQLIFQEIEFVNNSEFNKKLIKIYLQSLNISKINDFLYPKMNVWFPKRLNDMECNELIARLNIIQFDDNMKNVLYYIILNEKPENRRKAAEILLKNSKNENTRIELWNFLSNAFHLLSQVIFAELIIKGWPSHPETLKLIKFANNSRIPELWLLGIYGDIVNNSFSLNEKLNKRISLIASDNFFHFSWNDLIIYCLKNGWKGNQDIKKKCLQSVKNETIEKGNINSEIAGILLIEEYFDDPDVITWLINEFEKEYPLILFEDTFIENYNSKYASNVQLSNTIEIWIKKYITNDNVIIYPIVNILKPSFFKIELLNQPLSRINMLTLCNIWGIDDPEVLQYVFRYKENCSNISEIAQILPKIIKKEEELFQILYNALKDKNNSHQIFSILEGLIRGCQNSDLNLISNMILDNISQYQNPELIIETLVLNFPENPKIKDYILNKYIYRPKLLFALLQKYPLEKNFQNKIYSLLYYLIEEKRELILNNLNICSDQQEFYLSFLRQYRDETEGKIKVICAIKYFKALKQFQTDFKDEIRILLEDLVCIGQNHKIKRQAAYCGLWILEQYELLKNTNPIIFNKKFFISIEDHHGPNYVFLQFLAENWTKLKEKLGENFYYLFIDEREGSKQKFWTSLSPFAPNYSDVTVDLVDLLIKNSFNNFEINFLVFLENRELYSLAKDYCLKYKNLTGDNLIEACFLRKASKFLANYYRSREKEWNTLIEQFNSENLPVLFLWILFISNPQHKYVETKYKELEKKKEWNIVEKTFHFCNKYTNEEFILFLNQIISDFYIRKNFSRLDLFEVIYEKIRENVDLKELIIQNIRKTTKIDEKISLLQILNQNNSITPELKMWCENELSQIKIEKIITEIGYDITDDRYKALEEVLSKICTNCINIKNDFYI